MAEMRKDLAHVAAPGFTAGIATGATIHGPTPDGNMHVTFFFDTAYPSRAPETTPGVPLPTGVVVNRAENPEEGFTIVRNNIATISMRPEQLEAIGKAIVQLSETRAKMMAEQAQLAQRGAGNVPS